MATAKTEILIATEINAQTNEVIERPLSEAELADFENGKTKFLELETAAEAKASARQSALAKLAELGLTAEEIAAL